MDILLVLGTVTPTEFEPVRRKMLDEGMNPIVRRIADHASNSSFFDELLEEDTEGDFDLLMLAASRAQIELLDEVLCNAQHIRDVRAFVLPVGASAETDWTWVTKDVPQDAATYQVQLSEDNGSPFLVGAGFGQTLEIN